MIEPGAVILTVRRGEFGNILIPGYWSHGAICQDKNWVIESLGRGVVKTRLSDFLKSKDDFIILLPKFADMAQQLAAVNVANRLVGMPYDWEFEPNDQEFYCFELIWYAYNAVVEDSPFERVMYFGEETILGDDFIDSGLWQPVFRA